MIREANIEGPHLEGQHHHTARLRTAESRPTGVSFCVTDNDESVERELSVINTQHPFPLSNRSWLNIMASIVTPPPLQGPTAKEKKYDRQLRLWASSGQQALEDAHILLLNHGAGAVGAETLKNLVLPGVGNFTIVDEQIVKEEDLGVNFFLEEESLGKSRADECCRLLRELNPDVNGQSKHQVYGVSGYTNMISC